MGEARLLIASLFLASIEITSTGQQFGHNPLTAQFGQVNLAQVIALHQVSQNLRTCRCWRHFVFGLVFGDQLAIRRTLDIGSTWCYYLS